MKVLTDGIQLCQLVVFDDPHDMGKEYIAQIDFFGNRILTSNVEPDIQWYKVYRQEICKNFFEYLIEAYHNGMPFDLNGGDFKENYKTVSEGGPSTTADAKPKEEEKKEAPKEVEKPKQSAKPAAKPKNPPSKIKRGKAWDIAYYDKETIELNESEVDMSTAVMVTACTNSNVVIHGKLNNVSLTACKNCAVLVDSVISAVELIKCDGVKVV
eukprot:CAMPEP_0168338848 /NCGR_PEP_ID=MMETSP0213-20121227/13105_1 /TAXON_ID=151035 /ORGANISM="Euplotes harpa, Strain FSP1.4" /LENGTH=211 /DNA_ID=CAMNT_0008344757 /DNA_START=362 /DNA_END=994 /DNA_ORIENTATION=-